MAIRQFKNKRTAHKLTEILNYPNIYFVGHNADKRQVVPGSEQNYGFDDDQGSYIHTPHDYVAYNFEVLKNLGKGSFGQVVKAFDQMTSTFVGLKMVRNERREIRTSELLRGQDLDNSRNVVHLLKQFTFREHVCMTFELLNMNICEMIKRNKFQGFPLPSVRKFAHTILICFDKLHRNKIIHCDFKPKNILLKEQGRSGTKAFDFGSS
uniref:dual-specificity kinase n=1 Tax=Mesocestoides corti TaxID=53468 RepID=A0A5K3G138_MESCO